MQRRPERTTKTKPGTTAPPGAGQREGAAPAGGGAAGRREGVGLRASAPPPPRPSSCGLASVGFSARAPLSPSYPARRAHAPGRRLIRSSAAAAMARAQARAALSRGCRRWLGGGRAPGGVGSCPRPGGRRGNGCQRGAGAAETFWGTVRGRAGGVLLNASAGVAGDVWRSSSPTLAKAGSLQSHR